MPRGIYKRKPSKVKTIKKQIGRGPTKRPMVERVMATAHVQQPEHDVASPQPLSYGESVTGNMAKTGIKVTREEFIRIHNYAFEDGRASMEHVHKHVQQLEHEVAILKQACKIQKNHIELLIKAYEAEPF